MNIIKSITIYNVKGIGEEGLKLEFSDLHANMPNILVAPNGFGKSTIAKCFKASSAGKMKLNKVDKQKDKIGSIQVELDGCLKEILYADETNSNMSKKVFVSVINSSLYAKSTSQNFGNFSTNSAELRIQDIILYNQIPEKFELQVGIKETLKYFNIKDDSIIKLCEQNINKYISKLFYSNNKDLKSVLKKVIDLIKLRKIDFNNLGYNDLKKTLENNLDKSLLTVLHDVQKISTECSDDKEWLLFSLVVTVNLYENFKNSYNSLGKYIEYTRYVKFKDLITERLNMLNTTKRQLIPHKNNNKLILKFDKADKMSNGERDILTFISQLTKFEIDFNKDIGILVIDEIFDYLDGSNLLIAQYYISKMIQKIKENSKVLFIMIFTHLDPVYFKNFYFKQLKVHYLVNNAKIFNINDDLIKMCCYRDKSDLNKSLKNKIDSSYFHFNNIENSFTDKEMHEIGITNNIDNLQFYEDLNNEVYEKYLIESNNEYNAFKVSLALRIKIEEKVYNSIVDKYQKEEYLKQHKTINKLKYAAKCGIDVPELYYLLQPIYNDTLHLSEDRVLIKNKFLSNYLKLSNVCIKNLIAKVFHK